MYRAFFRTGISKVKENVRKDESNCRDFVQNFSFHRCVHTRPIGYFIAVLIQFKMAAMPIRFIDCFGSFGLTAFLFATTVAEDWKNDIQAINENVQNKPAHDHILEQLIDLIRYTNIKQFEFPF